MANDAITVITPSFNPGEFLLPCLESVVNQGSVVEKHIVVDGGSDDGTVDILKDFSKSNRHLVWSSRTDKGQSEALNTALDLVETEYFGWLNADDCYFLGGLQGLQKCLVDPNSRQRPSIVYGDYKVIDALGNVIKIRRQPTFNFWVCLYGHITVQNVAAIFRTDDVRAAGGFDNNLHFCMDYELILRLSKVGSVDHTRHFVGMFRQHQKSKTSRLQHVNRNELSLIRQRMTNRSRIALSCLGVLGKIRFAGGLVREGCLASRFGIDS